MALVDNGFNVTAFVEHCANLPHVRDSNVVEKTKQRVWLEEDLSHLVTGMTQKKFREVTRLSHNYLTSIRTGGFKFSTELGMRLHRILSNYRNLECWMGPVAAMEAQSEFLIKEFSKVQSLGICSGTTTELDAKDILIGIIEEKMENFEFGQKEKFRKELKLQNGFFTYIKERHYHRLSIKKLAKVAQRVM